MRVSEYFAGKNIFLTGGSGFVGKAVIEKVLRSCPDVGKIYVLIRSKKGITPQERWNLITKNIIFDKLRETNPDSLKKIIIVEGDIVELKLGLSESSRQTLIDNVNIIYHIAASVTFDLPLKRAILENVRSTREIIELAKELRHLIIFVHVSSTYCNCDRSVVEEKIYPSHGNWKDAIKFVEEADPHVIEYMTHKYIDQHPNTYTYSKSLAEQVVLELCKGQIPTIILRPSIVISTFSEPFPGWNDNLNGPVGLYSAGGKGIIRIMWCDPNVDHDYIPVDIVARVLLMSTFQKSENRNLDEIEVYNVSKYRYLQINMHRHSAIYLNCLKDYPFSQILWYPRPSQTKCWYSFYIQMILFHLLPAICLDMVMTICQRKPMFFRLQRKVYIANNCLKTFSFKEWDFKNDKMINLAKNLHLDKDDNYEVTKYLYLNEKGIIEYHKDCLIGVGKCIFKEDYSDLEKNRKFYWRFWVVDVIVKTLFLVVLLWYVFVKHDAIHVVWNTIVNYLDKL